MEFGRKRVQYRKFIWMYYRFDGFDVYFTAQGKNLALYTANYVQNHLGEMEDRIGFQTQTGLRFIVFNRLTDYKQSNIGYIDEATQANSNTGGITRFLDNKVFLYFEGDYLDFERQIRRGIAELIVSQAITGSKIGTQYKNSYLMDLPRWFTGGAASYLSRPWDEELDERMATAVRQKNYKYFSSLEGEEAVFAGHSFWYFVSETFGEDAVARCIRVVATERRLNKTFRIALNTDFKDLMAQWRNFYLFRYAGPAHDTLLLSSTLPRTNRTDHVYQRMVLNPAGKEAAFVTNKLGRAKVYLQTTDPARRYCIYRAGAAINDNPDYSFPLLCFHPNGNALGLLSEEKGRTALVVYRIERNRKGRFRRVPVRRSSMRYYMDMFEKVNSFSFSPDGRTVALGATRDGYPDIYLFRLGAGTYERITYDLYDDYDPIFIPGTDWLVFSSNRPDDTIRKREKFEIAPSFHAGRNLFAYDLKAKGNRLFAMTDEDVRTILSSPRPLDASTLTFASNKYGQTNLAVGLIGKTIAHIDTAVHYRNTFKSATITDWDPGMLSYDLSVQRGEYAQVRKQANRRGRFLLGTDSLGRLLPGPVSEMVLQERKVEPSYFKKQYFDREKQRKRRKVYQDSLQRALLADTALQAARKLEEEKAASQFLQLRNADRRDRKALSSYDRWLLERAGLWYDGPESETDSAEGYAGGKERSSEKDAAVVGNPFPEFSRDFLSSENDPAAKSDSSFYRAGNTVDSSLAAARGSGLASRTPSRPPAFPAVLVNDSVLESQPLLAEAWRKWQYVSGRSGAHQGGSFVPVPDSVARQWFAFSLTDDSLAAAYPKIPPKQNMYEVEYMVNSSTAQLGFNYLNACYQTFTNSQTPIYLNPTVNGFTQIAISDLMENHRLIGGFAFSLDFTSTEYLFSYEYLERRLGHQIILHMLNLNDNSYYPYKQNTYDAYYVMKYPISPVSSLRGTVFGRYDRTIQQAIDYPSLMTETTRELRVGLKGEWVYDHSRFITQNIYFGTRGKVWLEYYQGVLNNKQNLFVFGVDFRDYRKLYKTMIWANRVAFSTSFGQQKLVYYMGGVDSWVAAKFNRDVETDPNQNYAYQTLATNMRGFTQNIRNGNTFAVINSEIRIPFMQVLSRMPVESSFLRHLQIVLFGDIGSAWSGWNPWSKDNLFYKKTIEDGKLTVVLDKDANPIVGGFGVGLRVQLFGYFLRGDVAWGVENGVMNKTPVFYFSLSTDF